MDDYNLWSDLLDTWQSTADWIKALIVLTPQATALAALALLLRHRQARRRAEPLPAGTLAYTIWREGEGRLHVLRHRAELSAGPRGEDKGRRPVGQRFGSGVGEFGVRRAGEAGYVVRLAVERRGGPKPWREQTGE